MNTHHDSELSGDSPRESAFPLAWCVALFVITAGLSACSRTRAQQPPAPPPAVTVATVIEREVTEWDEFTGRLEAVDTVAVRPRVSGYVSAVRFTEGTLVQRGDLLFQIDPRPFQAEVDRLRAELARAKATVQRATSELRRAERLRVENAISDEEHGRREAFNEESSAQVSAVEAALRAAELNLEFTSVTAPITGRVGRAVITEGNLVSSGLGEATLLTTVVSIDPIYAYFDADEQVFLRYQEAARHQRARGTDARWQIRMALATDTGFPREGRVDFLDNQLDAQTGTIRGRAVFRNQDGALTPGLFVRLRVAGGGHYQGRLVQDRAVGTDLGKKFVLVVDDEQTVRYRTVTLGPLVEGLRVVRDGLEPDDLVVINGLQRVRPGGKVTPSVVAMDDVTTQSTDPDAPAHTAANTQ